MLRARLAQRDQVREIPGSALARVLDGTLTPRVIYVADAAFEEMAAVCPVPGCITMVDETNGRPFESWNDRIAKGTAKATEDVRALVETMARYGHGTPDDWLERHVYSRFSWQGVGALLIIDVLLFGAIGATPPSISPTVGKFCTPEKPAASTSRRNSFITRNGSVPHTPANTGVCLTTGMISKAISFTISLALP